MTTGTAAAPARIVPRPARQQGVWVDCAASSALCLVLLVLVLRLYEADLRVPLQYVHDAVVFLMKTKAIAEDEWVWHNSRIGMPFGADWRDFPMNVTLDSAGLWLLTRFTKTPGLALNLYWILAVGATGGVAAYALRRLSASRTAAVCAGAVYALLPYVFYRGLMHLHSLYYAAPLVAASALELGRGRLCPVEGGGWRRTLKAVPGYAWAGSAVLGLCYAYTVFFGVFVIGGAMLLGWLSGRSRRHLLPGLALLAVTGATVLADMSPSLAYWARNGRNPSMSFKGPFEAEMYGLKLRFLLTPTPNHPVPVLREMERRLAAAGFPYDTENRMARLGTVGAAGFLYLLGVALGAAAGAPWARSDTARLLGFAAALTLLCILLATVGGFGDFFNTFVSPEIRCYNRIFPFIAFFSILAVALLVTGAEARWRARKLPGGAFAALLALATTAAAFDQFPRPGPLPHAARERLFRSDAEFVRRAEAVLPPGSAVFQLPYTPFPAEMHKDRMIDNDQGRPYIHSAGYRWSWGALSGSTAAEWNRQTAAVPAAEMLERLHHRGFSGLWVDLYGYPEADSPEALLTAAAGAAPLRSADSRYLFYDLRPFRERARAREASLTATEQLARHPVETTFERGFYPAEQAGATLWRWSQRRSRIVFINPLPVHRTIHVSMSLGGSGRGEQVVQVSAVGIAERIHMPARYRRTLLLPPGGLLEMDLACVCDPALAPADPRRMYFSVSGVEITNE